MGETTMLVTVSQMSADSGMAPDLIRAHCRLGNIEGAMNVGTGARSHWRVPLAGWEKFKTDIRAKRDTERARVGKSVRDRSGRNLLGV